MNLNNSNPKTQMPNSKTSISSRSFGIGDLKFGILKISLVAVVFFFTSAFSSPFVATEGRATVPDVC